MQQQRRRSRIIIGLLSLSVLAGVAMMAIPAQAVSGPGPYYAVPAWDQIKGVGRFLILTNWNSQAVLDKETGLVWERAPNPINNFSWDDARIHCMGRTIGNRKGWRLPSIDELASLVHPLNTGPALPDGHPFVIAVPIVNVHWSATTNTDTDTQAWFVNFGDGAVLDFAPKANGEGNAWCVRGAMNAATY